MKKTVDEAQLAYAQSVSADEQAPDLASKATEAASVETAKAESTGKKVPFTFQMGILMAILVMAILISMLYLFY